MSKAELSFDSLLESKAVHINNIQIFLVENIDSSPTNTRSIIVLVLDLEIKLEKNTQSLIMLVLAPRDYVTPGSSGKTTRNALPKSVSLPALKSSDFFEKNSAEYYDTLAKKKQQLIRSETVVPILKSFVSPFPEILSRVSEGLKYHSPEICEDGVNGTYFLSDRNGKYIAVFKPIDEEGNSDGNPKNKKADRMDIKSIPNKGIRVGEAALREVAAYHIDREGFIGVPRTDLVKISHRFNGKTMETKIGSMQEFIENDGSSEDFGCTGFSAKDVHKIGIIDIQMLNMDRHAGNVLIKKNNQAKKLSLIPIDHGFSLPDGLDCPWFEWMSWPQAKVPFDDETKDYVMRIDIEKDAALLERLGIRKECIKTMRITTTLLKKAVLQNKTLYDIGRIICKNNDEPSILENMWKNANEARETMRGKVTLDEERISFQLLNQYVDKYLSNRQK